jgi:hypothetical protein
LPKSRKKPNSQASNIIEKHEAESQDHRLQSARRGLQAVPNRDSHPPLALRGFEVYNDEEDGRQAVVALVKGDEQRAAKFCDSAKTQRPQRADVDEVRSEEFSGDVMPLWQFASIITVSQMNKAIQILSAAEK